MNIFIFLGAVLLSSAADSSGLTEVHYFNYVTTNTDVNRLASDGFAYLSSINNDVYKVATDFHKNITSLRHDYGFTKAAQIKAKYRTIAAENAKIMPVNQVCQRIIKDVLATNDKYQKNIFALINTILDYFKTGYTTFYENLIDHKATLIKLEKEAFDCNDLFEKEEDTMKVWDCGEEALRKMEGTRSHIKLGMSSRLQKLVEQANLALDSLYEALENQRILPFYDARDNTDTEVHKNCTP